MSRLDKPNVTLAVVTLSHAVNHMYTGVLPLLYTPMLNELGLTYTQLGVIIAVHLFTLGVMQFGSSVLAVAQAPRDVAG